MTDPAKHSQQVDIVHRTHQIYCGIKGKDIVLLHGNPPGRTDTETFISLPIEDPEAELILAHEWQHVFFKSNLRARAAFAEAYSENICKRLPATSQKGIEDFIHILVNGLDDIRVCSLWELIYPHSADQVQKRWKRIIVGSGRYQHDIVMYLMGLGLGLEVSMDRSEWTRYKSTLKDAVEKVIRRGFPTCLLAARWVIESVLADITAQHLAPNSYMVMPPKPVQFIPSSAPVPPGSRFSPPTNYGATQATPEESTKQSVAITKLHLGSSKVTRASQMINESWRMMDTDKMPPGPDPDWKGTEDIVRIAMGVSAPQQVNVVLNQSQLEVEKVIADLKNRTKTLTPAQRLMKGMEGRAVFKNIKPTDVDELHLSNGDSKLVYSLRHSFLRLMDRRRQLHSDFGATLDPQAYIDLLNGSSSTDIFTEDENSKGFSALILLDMSGSMKPKWETVARACKIIAKAMKFPSASLEVWGFTSPGYGTASIFRFEDPSKGYTGPGIKDAWGLTPLHIAVEIALRKLYTMPGSAQHLLVLTDGYPTHMSSNRERMADSGDLFSEVSRHISRGRKKGVNVTGVISGTEIDDTAATIMFGHRRFWTRVSEQQEDLFQSLIELARRAFVGYLRSR